MSMSVSGRVIAAMVVLALLAGCKKEVRTEVRSEGATVQEALAYDGPKARVMVTDFTCKAAKCEQGIGDGVSDMLTTALFKSGRFVVLESGSAFNAALEEQALAMSGAVREGGGPETGRMEAADLVVTGAITGFEPEAEGTGFSLFGAGGGLPLGLGGGSSEAHIAADIRLVDTRTRRIVNATTVEGFASNFSLKGLGGARVGGIPLGGSLGTYSNTPMEKAVRVMLDNAVQTIGQMVPVQYYRPDNQPIPGGMQSPQPVDMDVQ